MMKEIDEKATNIWVSWKWIRSKKGDRGQISCEGFVWSKNNNLVCYVKNSVRPLIVGVGLAEVMPTKYIRKNEFKRIWMSKKKKKKKTKMEGKKDVWLVC